jgi:uncharacterized protein (TIGR03435 family)
MLQNLLAERLRIEMHHEPREHSTADLVVAKGGAKMKLSKFDENAAPDAGSTLHLEKDSEGFPVIPETSGPRTLAMNVNRQTAIVTNKVTMNRLAALLARNLNMPIADKTGLPGSFAFLLHYQPLGDAPQTVDSSDPGGAAALTVDKGPIDVLVIDKAERIPIEN